MNFAPISTAILSEVKLDKSFGDVRLESRYEDYKKKALSKAK